MTAPEADRNSLPSTGNSPASLFARMRGQAGRYRVLRFNETPRLWPGFALTDEELSRARYEDLLPRGLGDLRQRGLAADLGECGGQHYFVYPPTAINNWEGYDLLNCVFPAPGHPLVRMTDELSPAQREHFRAMVNACFRRFREVAAARGESFDHLFFLQHVAPYQLHHFRNSYPHLHAHAFGFLRGARHQGAPTRQALRTFRRHKLFFDPFTDLAGEILAHDLGVRVAIDPATHSLLVGTRDLEGTISPAEMDLMAQVSTVWKERWRQLAHCFCDLAPPHDFDVHAGRRHDPRTIRRNLDTLFRTDLAFLPAAVRDRLGHLADRLRGPHDWNDPRQNWKNAMSGPYGSIGVVFDCQRQCQEVRIAPRVFAATRTGATDGTWLTLKSRLLDMEAAPREAILRTQRVLLSGLVR